MIFLIKKVSVVVLIFIYISKLFREMSESLNLPTGHTYHTGVRRDEDRVWRRSSDGAAVRLEDWWAGYPRSDASHKFLYWSSWNGSYKNLILNYSDDSDYFVCEY